MSMRQALVRVAHAGPVAALTLTRPARSNALVPELLLDLCVALEQIGRRPETRVLILGVEGDSFSIGGDLHDLAAGMSAPALQNYAAEVAGLLNQAVLALLRLPQPVVAAVQGPVVGGSLGLVLASDLVVMADDAVIEVRQAGAGLAPESGRSALLPRLVGARRAAACLLLDFSLGAREALDWGVVNQLVPASEVAAAVRRAAEGIAAAPEAATRAAKRLVGHETALADIETALEAERQRFVAAIASPSLHARRGAGDRRAGAGEG